jgi:5-(carboxyamino)imidazole ribonucleotide mutase
MPKIAVVMGSDSDYEVVKKGTELLKQFDVSCEMRVISAHRTPHEAADFARNAEDNGIEVIIAAAGKAAHLAGVMAGISPLPVIGLPIKTSMMGGLDSLLSVVQMPKGIPVATVAVDGAENAALLAVQILSVKYPELRKQMVAYKQSMRETILEKDQTMQSNGF